MEDIKKQKVACARLTAWLFSYLDLHENVGGE